jgi:hypothetical protein
LGGKSVKYGQKILKLLKAVWALSKSCTAEGTRRGRQQLLRKG